MDMPNNETRKIHFIFAITLVVLVLASASVALLSPNPKTHAQKASFENTIYSNSSSDTNNTGVVFWENLTTAQGDIIPNEWIITFRENATIDASVANSTILSSLVEEAKASNTDVIETFPELGIIVIKAPKTSYGNGTPALDISGLDDDPNILSIEPNQIVTIYIENRSTGPGGLGAD
jgi:hypothetical protein